MLLRQLFDSTIFKMVLLHSIIIVLHVEFE